MSTESTPRPSQIRWQLEISPQPQNRAEARDTIMNCLYRAMDIAHVAFAASADRNMVLDTVEDLVVEASHLVERWFHLAREEGQP
jgi:hypothetical protein